MYKIINRLFIFLFVFCAKILLLSPPSPQGGILGGLERIPLPIPSHSLPISWIILSPLPPTHNVCGGG